MPELPKLGPRAVAQLACLEEVRRRWTHVRALVEQADRSAGGAAGDDRFVKRILDQLGRAAVSISELLADHGFSRIADDVRELVLITRHGEGIRRGHFHRMHEIASVVGEQVEAAQRAIRRGEQGV